MMKNYWKWGRLFYCIKLRHTWPMLSIAWTPCWAETNAPCSLHSLCITWREALGHLLPPSSSLDTRSSGERFFFPADLGMQMLTMKPYTASVQYLQREKKNKKIDERYLNISRRYLIMFCRASWSSLTPVLWNLCPDEQQKTSHERGTREDGLLQVKEKILRKDWLTAEISAESTPLARPWR